VLVYFLNTVQMTPSLPYAGAQGEPSPGSATDAAVFATQLRVRVRVRALGWRTTCTIAFITGKLTISVMARHVHEVRAG